MKISVNESIDKHLEEWKKIFMIETKNCSCYMNNVCKRYLEFTYSIDSAVLTEVKLGDTIRSIDLV